MDILLPMHIGAGIFALVASLLAVLSTKGKKLHIQSGRIYFWGMLGIFVTAIPMALISGNQFLFITAVFSFYLAFAGIRFARNRSGIPATIDWIAVSLMLLSGAGMWLLAVLHLMDNNPDFIVPVVFGTLALALGYRDYRSHKNETAKGPQRIASHLSNMLGGTIAVITAVLVVNINMQPGWLLWILPTLVITPLIIWWNTRVLK
ncbi:MAG: hypothetical protein ACPHLL_05505 [Porticoccaceae bacterium]